MDGFGSSSLPSSSQQTSPSKLRGKNQSPCQITGILFWNQFISWVNLILYAERTTHACSQRNTSWSSLGPRWIREHRSAGSDACTTTWRLWGYAPRTQPGQNTTTRRLRFARHARIPTGPKINFHMHNVLILLFKIEIEQKWYTAQNLGLWNVYVLFRKVETCNFTDCTWSTDCTLKWKYFII